MVVKRRGSIIRSSGWVVKVLFSNQQVLDRSVTIFLAHKKCGVLSTCPIDNDRWKSMRGFQYAKWCRKKNSSQGMSSD